MGRVLNRPSNMGVDVQTRNLKKKKITPRASLVLCDDRVRDPSLIRLIFRDMYDVPARRFPFRSVTIQSICQVESHSTEIYSRILFLEEANKKNNGKIILNGIIFDNENYLVESLQLCQHDIETNKGSSVFGID